MNPRIAEARPAPLMPFPANTRLSDAQAVQLEARRVRDALILAALRDLFTGTVARVRVWHERRRALAELRALSDRELADIGLNRATIITALVVVPAKRPVIVSHSPVAVNDGKAARAVA